jgi:predicted transcriptional regulator
MSTAVLLSIKPEYAEAIFSGVKQFEFRRTVFRNQDIEKVYLYASAPISRVVGFFLVRDILQMDPEELWQKTNQGAGLSRKRFLEYFSGCTLGFALQVGDAERFDEPCELEGLFGISHPPQSFRYVPSLQSDPLTSRWTATRKPAMRLSRRVIGGVRRH